MSPSPEVRVGERIRFYRQGKQKTQVVVAGLAGITEDYLSQIERGLKTPTISLLQKFSRILGVRTSELLGESTTEHDDVMHPIGSALQRSLMAYGDARGRVVDVPELRARVDDAWKIWQCSANRYTEASAVVAELTADVQETERALRFGDPAQRREAAKVAADMYFFLRTFTKRIGRTDLSLLAADRGVMAAEAADDPVRIAAAKWNLGHILLAQDEADAAEGVALTAMEDLQRAAGEDNSDAIAMRGALALVGVVAAVRKGDGWAARDRLREDAWPAARHVGDGNVMWTVFGPTNVGLHAVSVEMETGESAQGLRYADDIDASHMASLERQTTFALEVARCYEQRRDDPGVLIHLMNAETTGPEDMRYNTLARDLAHGLVKRARPTYAGQVQSFARRIGLMT